MYKIDLTRPAEDDEHLKDVLRDAELSEFYQRLKDEGCTVKELYKLSYRNFAQKCADVGIDPRHIVRFHGSLNNYMRCKEPEFAKSVNKKRHMIKRIVESSPGHYFKQVLSKSDLLPFHERFMQEGFTSFHDFFCISEKKFVKKCVDVGLSPSQIQTLTINLNALLKWSTMKVIEHQTNNSISSPPDN